MGHRTGSTVVVRVSHRRGGIRMEYGVGVEGLGRKQFLRNGGPPSRRGGTLVGNCSHLHAPLSENRCRLKSRT